MARLSYRYGPVTPISPNLSRGTMSTSLVSVPHVMPTAPKSPFTGGLSESDAYRGEDVFTHITLAVLYSPEMAGFLYGHTTRGPHTPIARARSGQESLMKIKQKVVTLGCGYYEPYMEAICVCSVCFDNCQITDF